MKLMTIVGARPQFIKAAPFSRTFRKNGIEILVHTGQHYDPNMSDVFFDELDIPRPDYHLGIGSLSHGAQTGRMLEAIEELLLKEKPDGLLVYGDTNSTLAGALAASKLHVPVFHVEAGLRSFNMRMPEEQNRVLTDHISALRLCPTENAVNLLKKEGITDGVFNTGDIMYDAVLQNKKKSDVRYSKMPPLTDFYGGNHEFLPGQYYLATIHRAENTDDIRRLGEIFKGFSLLDKPVVISLHPRTRAIIEGKGLLGDNVCAVGPVGYLPMLWLTGNAKCVLTDSGGLQKEAYFLKTPCVTMRDETEWVETLGDGWNVLAKIDRGDIAKKATRPFDVVQPQKDYFGNGSAAECICKIIFGYDF